MDFLIDLLTLSSVGYLIYKNRPVKKTKLMTKSDQIPDGCAKTRYFNRLTRFAEDKVQGVKKGKYKKELVLDLFEFLQPIQKELNPQMFEDKNFMQQVDNAIERAVENLNNG